MEKKHLNILVTGASGFLGRHLIKRLESTGHSVVAIYRTVFPSASRNVYAVNCDLTNFHNLRSILRNTDMVIHLAWDHGVYRKENYSLESSPNLQATQTLIKAMENTNIRRMIFVSCSQAGEHAKLNYCKEKYRAECLVLNSEIREKLVVRPDAVWSSTKDDPFLKGLSEIMQYPLYPSPLMGEALRPLHIADFTENLYSDCLSQQGFSANVKMYLGEESMSIQEIQRIFTAKIDRKLRLPVKGWWGRKLFELIERRRISRGKREIFNLYPEWVGVANSPSYSMNALVKSQQFFFRDLAK